MTGEMIVHGVFSCLFYIFACSSMWQQPFQVFEVSFVTWWLVIVMCTKWLSTV